MARSLLLRRSLLPLIAALWLSAASPFLLAAEWSRLADLPNKEGLAGSFDGVSGEALLVAGGANFPDKKPADGGKKVWHDQVYVLEQPDGPWRVAGRLARPLAYGVSISHRGVIICVGGSDARRHYADVFRLTWRDGRLITTSLPALPKPLANGCGALVGDRLFVAGGQESPASLATREVWQLDLAAEKPQWSEVARLPGKPRILAISASFLGRFWIIGGAELITSKDGQIERRYLRDAWSFDLKAGWQRVGDLPHPSVASPSPAPIDAKGIFLLGGDDGSQLAVAPAEHRGFPKEILHYDPVADRWTSVGDMPAARVTVPCVRWKDGWVIPSGEIRPGIRSPEVWRFQPPNR